MYICICNGITDREINEAIEAGANTLEALQHELGVATGCGSCLEIVLNSFLGGNERRPITNNQNIIDLNRSTETLILSGN